MPNGFVNWRQAYHVAKSDRNRESPDADSYRHNTRRGFRAIENAGMEDDMGSGNKAICLWFVLMLFTGIMMLKGTYDQPKMLVALIAFSFFSSAWFFMDGLLSAMRPAQPKVELTSDVETKES